ncbi:peptidoglycan-binding domain-containing protein [Streptomyces sp. 7N604]|uniref:peptidoglycan-binding domain-containing protein n=1 Tax=Streptomyces sp. 7N604 TaxID=3457415 RepID=UPI003FD1D9D0
MDGRPGCACGGPLPRPEDITPLLHTVDVTALLRPTDVRPLSQPVDETAPLPRQRRRNNATQLPRPMDPPTTSPLPEDLGLFAYAPPPRWTQDPDGGDGGDRDDGRNGRSGHRRRERSRIAGGPTAAAAAVVASVGAVLLGMQLLSGGDSGGDDDRAAPDERVRPTAVLPTGDGDLPTGPPPSQPGKPTGSPGTADPRRSASASRPATSRPTVTAARDGNAGESSGPVIAASVAVIGLGESGPEVLELQLRLKQEHAYAPKADGVYDSDVQSAVARYQRNHDVPGDPVGTYGPNTRRVLESRTAEP